jgi:phosphatidylserine/phosphatidylglycerophosphate/cardiolipin synthase-like enzyme
MKNAVAGLIFLFSITSLVYADTKVYFSPNGGCQEAVIQEISKAQKTIVIAMYELTNRQISRELMKAKGRGVWIRIFLDQGEANGRYSQGKYLMNKGIDIRFYTGTGLMHNKFAVIDDKVLITGSYNWTVAAERENQDNLLIITDDNTVRQYALRFDTLWAAPQDNPVRDSPIKVRVSGDVTVTAVHRS